MVVQFGDEYRRYMAAVPAFFPKLGSAEQAKRELGE
jgi:protein-S-isoprenylcysteine O-methyltransferase Ste14